MAYYIREPGGELIARLTSGGAVRYYHFDALGSTRLLTDSNGNITDEYTYDAWGKLMEHTGFTAQPYQFVGQLGYYSHYQDENLFAESGWQLLQLGVRFYDPEVGRFGQVDKVKHNMQAAYMYCDGKPLTEADPDGKCPKYHMDKSCTKLLGSYASYAANCAEKYCFYVDEQFTSSGLGDCNVTIIVKCTKDKLAGGNACGKRNASDIIVSTHPDCPSLCCLMLHEAIHVCMGPATGKNWPEVFIPGCGNISYNHSAPPNGCTLP